MYKSLDYFLKKYPFFLNKKSDSNFTKTKKVFNNRLKDISNNIFIVYLAGKLEKSLLIWKEQDSAYNYTINFVATFPFLESVTCYKNDEVIYSESYTYEEEISSFTYSYESTSENIIPTDKFKIIVTTYEEYCLVKGFPENDEIAGDEYDHDSSLDSFGLLYNIPRKTYKLLDNTEFDENQIINYYTKTEPKFNDKASEDDYHYMNRIINYINYLQDVPLPVLEIWKIYGLPIEKIEFVNREKYLCKMFEESRHLDSNGEYNPYWTPERWEHKDLMCGKEDEEIFFFANVNNSSPIQGQPITFNFNFFNEFARKVSNYYFIVPYLMIDGELRLYAEGFNIDTMAKGFSWTINTEDIPGISNNYIFDFTFRAYEKYSDYNDLNTNYIESDSIRVIIKGCGNADLYVDSVEGSNSNDGTTRDTALKSLDYAISQIHGSNNVIALLNKNERFYIDDVLKIDESCSIISCPAGAVIYQNNGFDIFKIMQDTHLYLQNILLKHKCCEMYAKSSDFINENLLNYSFDVNIPDWICKINTVIRMNENSYNLYAHHKYDINGALLTMDDRLGVKDETVNLHDSDEELIDTTTTGTSGDYTFEHLFDSIGNFSFIVKHPESKKYCNSETDYRVTVSAMPTNLSASTVDKIFIDESFNIDYEVLDYFSDNINVGVLKLYEDNTLIKTVNNGETLSYTPNSDGTHNYRLVFSHDNTYVTSEVTFSVEVTKYETSIALIGEGKSIYLSDENISLTSLIIDENSTPLANASLKLYDGTTLITTITSDSEGKVNWSNKLNVGTHNLHLEYEETRKYYSSISNNYRVRVRQSALSDINLSLYPEHKVLLSKATSIPINVYASDRNGNPLATSFKIWNTYDSGCESNNTATYTTGNDGWCTINVSTQAIVNCEGVYLQAISTVDEDVCSNVAHVMYVAEPELTVSGDIFTTESYYSYSDDVIHVNGYLVDNDDDPVPNEDITLKMIADGTTVESKSLITDILGEWNTTFTTTNNVRGKDLTFKIEYNKTTKKYSSFTESTIVEFKQLATRIVSDNITLPCGDIIPISGEIVDENNRKVDTGTLNIKFNNVNYSETITTGDFTESIDSVLPAGTYPITFTFAENTFYKKSTLSRNLIVTKVTPVLNVITEYSIPVFESILIPFGVSRNTRIPLTGTVKLTDTSDNSEINSVDVNDDEISVVFDETGTVNAKLTYSGNGYLNSVNVSMILTVFGPYYIISCNKDEDITLKLVDEFSPGDSEDVVILTKIEGDYPQIIITDDEDYDDSSLTSNDIVIIDSDNPEPDIVLFDEGEEE